MNLHLTYDNQFIDNIIRCAEELGRDDKFIIYTNEQKERLDSVKSSVPFAQIDSQQFKDLVGDVHQYRNIYIHWLEGRIVEFVNALPKQIRVIWCFWGGDGLELDPLISWVYQPKSLNYFRKQQRISASHLKILRLYFYRRKIKRVNDKKHLEAMRRVDFFAHYLLMDYEKIRNVSGMHAYFIPFHYAALEDLVDTSSSPNICSGGDILLGNSDTLTNNHFEAIDALSKMNLNGRKVICPLSYERGKYAKVVKRYGEQKLSAAFFPLLEFMPRSEYDVILSNVSIAVMNHNRSQALGNIVSLLWSGTKVFMSDASTLFQFLKGEGMILFSIQKDLNCTREDVFEPISTEELARNKALLIRCFGNETHKSKIQAMLEL